MSSMRTAMVMAATAAFLCAAPAAQAGGFLEGIVGMAAPMGDDDYDDAVDVSPKLGLRVGGLSTQDSGAQVGFEVSADWTPLSSEVDFPNTEESLHRIRGLAGVRASYVATDMVALTARFAAGVDYVRASFRSEVLGVSGEVTETDVGLALDPSLALQVTLGEIAVGGQVGFPIGLHDHDGEDFDIDYTSVDLDLMFVITAHM